MVDVTSSRLPLIGREDQQQRLWTAFSAARTSGLRVALIAGEPGIGKSRLLGEFCARALDAGALVLRGGSSEAEGMPPFLPFLEALGRHIAISSREQLARETGD